MNVRTTSDCTARQGTAIPEGSFIGDVKEFARCYRGLWCSMYGSFVVTVPKSACVIEEGPK